MEIFLPLTLAVLLWTNQAQSARITTSPTNQAVAVGGRASFTCQVEFSGGTVVEWRAYYPGGDADGVLLYDSHTGQNRDPRYETQVRGYRYELVMATVTKDMVGRYYCAIREQNMAGANLVVMENFHCSASAGKVMEGQEVTLRAEAYYHGELTNQFRVQAGFTNVSEERTKDMSSKTYNDMITLRATVTADREDHGISYQMWMNMTSLKHFKPTDVVFTDKCSAGFDVMFAPSLPVITRSSKGWTLKPGEVIKCNAYASPLAQYTWRAVGMDDVIEGPQLILENDMIANNTLEVNITCTATNKHGSSTSVLNMQSDYPSLATVVGPALSLLTGVVVSVMLLL